MAKRLDLAFGTPRGQHGVSDIGFCVHDEDRGITFRLDPKDFAHAGKLTDDEIWQIIEDKAAALAKFKDA